MNLNGFRNFFELNWKWNLTKNLKNKIFFFFSYLEQTQSNEQLIVLIRFSQKKNTTKKTNSHYTLCTIESSNKAISIVSK